VSVTTGELLAWSGWRPGTLLSTLQGPGCPAENDPVRYPPCKGDPVHSTSPFGRGCSDLPLGLQVPNFHSAFAFWGLMWFGQAGVIRANIYSAFVGGLLSGPPAGGHSFLCMTSGLLSA
jgi:hypothetical protein